METYRSCYDASDFESKNMKLDEWITYKTNVRNKSQNIKISIDNRKNIGRGRKCQSGIYSNLQFFRH